MKYSTTTCCVAAFLPLPSKPLSCLSQYSKEASRTEQPAKRKRSLNCSQHLEIAGLQEKLEVLSSVP